MRTLLSQIISDSCGEAEEVDLAAWFDVLFYADEAVVQDSQHCFLNPTVEFFGLHIYSSRWPVHRPTSEILQDRQIALLAGYDAHKGHLFRRIDNLDPARKGREEEYDAEVDAWAKQKLKDVGHRFLQNLELSYAFGARWGHQYQDPVALAEWEEWEKTQHVNSDATKTGSCRQEKTKN